MCEYCSKDYSTLAQKEIRSSGVINTTHMLDLNFSRTGGKLDVGRVEGAYIAANFFDREGDECWLEVVVPIQYCPFCGQKLNSEEA